MAQNTAPAMSGIGSPSKSGSVQSTGKSGNSQLGKNQNKTCHLITNHLKCKRLKIEKKGFSPDQMNLRIFLTQHFRVALILKDYMYMYRKDSKLPKLKIIGPISNFFQV